MGAIAQAPGRPGVVVDTGMCGRSVAREPGDPTSDHRSLPVWSASGRRGVIADDAREVGRPDSAIVAGNPTNKAERSAAELGSQGRGGRGECDPAKHGPAQSRGTVSQALARIRQAARQRKKERFTALLRALASRRTYIPKAGGKQRPLAIAALEGKIVKRATVAVLNAIYEEERNSHLRVVVVLEQLL